ncbi:MAG: endo-1,4-beta-xylanase [Bacteroidales bacterium]|nr:endo-1,4-beta-xylanase [Bacteroidales bacterium]
MRHYKYYYLAALSLGLLSSCADDLTQNLTVENAPLSVQVMEELNRLDPLKSYKTASNMSPNFKIGGAVSAEEFAKGGNVGSLAAANLDEVTPKTDMYYGSCISDAGEADFGKITTLINSAKKAGVSVFGSALAWNSNQRPAYYQSLFDKRGEQIKEEKKKEREAQGGGSVSTNYCIEYDCGEAGANSWDKQAIYTLPVAMEQDKEYVLTVRAKATQGGKVALWPIWSTSENKNQWGGSNDVQYLDTYDVQKEWTDLEWKFKASFPHDKMQFVFGQVGGKIYFDDLKVVAAGSAEDMVTNGNFDKESIDGWTNNWQGPSYTRFAEQVVSTGGNFCIEYDCGEAGANPWDKQAIYTMLASMEASKHYVVTMRAKATQGGKVALWPIWSTSENKNQWGGSNDVQYLDTYDVQKQWTDLKWEFDASFPHDQLQFVFGQVGGKIYFDELKVVEDGSEKAFVANGTFDDASIAGWGNNWQGPAFTRFEDAAEAEPEATSAWKNVVSNSDCEGSDVSSFFAKEYPSTAPVAATIVSGEGKDGGKCVKVTAAAKVEQPWDSQFWITASDFLFEGTKIKVAFDYKANKEATASTQAHAGAGDYNDWQFAGDVKFTTSWQHFEKEITLSATQAKTDKGGFKSCAFNLSVDTDVEYYFDNMEILVEEKIPAGEISTEEKAKILTNAMNSWVEGIMEATAGSVKAWDVVKDPISDGAVTKNGVYGLQHTDKPNTKDGYTDVFFWQDILGDEAYVQTAVSAARRYYKGTAEDLKLFVNEYGLDKDPKKCESLVKWLGAWENDTVKIDGVGVQLHLACSENATENETTLSNLATMFQTLTATGKLVRVSELDIVYTDNSGSVVKVSSSDYSAKGCDAAIGDFYKNVIKTYLANVPAAQQYGICQWSLTDEGDAPKGLWTDKFLRKKTYEGFADGLSGK